MSASREHQLTTTSYLYVFFNTGTVKYLWKGKRYVDCWHPLKIRQKVKVKESARKHMIYTFYTMPWL